MTRVATFTILYLACCGYALLRGGAAERTAAILYVVAVQLSHLVVRPYALRYAGVETGVLLVDGGTFLLLYGMSVASSRFWPMWMAGMQGAAVVAHLAGLAPRILPRAYGDAVTLWSYAILLTLAWATWRHRRRLSRYGIDPSWWWQLPAAYRAGGPADDRRCTGVPRPGGDA